MKSVLVLGLLLAAAVPAQVGRIDTVGGTTYDWQGTGPARRCISNAPGCGIPVVWVRSLSDQTTFPDRNMSYNWYDYATRTWAFNDSDFIQSGVNVFTERAGFGNVATLPESGMAYVSAHAGTTPLSPRLARELLPGSGLWEYCQGPEGYAWPVVALDSAGWAQVAMIDEESLDNIHWARVRTWCQWDPAQPMAEPGYPSHNVSASRTSQHVVVTWVDADGDLPYWAYWRESRDGGTSWGLPQELVPPDAFGGDTVESFHLGVFPYCDRQGRAHIVAEVMPVIGGVGHIMPAEIWHWCPDNSPRWTRIHRAECAPENLGAAVGYNAIYAGRPSIGEDRLGGLHVAWEQFDSANVEPGPPEYLRADIWYCRDSDDNGASWQAPVQLTVPDQTSKRFPCIYDFAVEDTMRVLYMIDVIAGFAVRGEGDPTRNPVVCQHVPIAVGGMVERPGPRLTDGDGGRSRTVYRAPELGLLDCRVLDIQGRDVTDRRGHLAPGVYFLALPPTVGREPSAVRKVIVQE